MIPVLYRPSNREWGENDEDQWLEQEDHKYESEEAEQCRYK